MNASQRESWLRDLLMEVMRGLVKDEALRAVLIFKGAWILNFQLGQSRHSRDIDATADPDWGWGLKGMEDKAEFLRLHMTRALHAHFEGQKPVRYSLQKVVTERRPAVHHPRGWDMLVARLYVTDHLHSHLRNPPPAEVEISAAEILGEQSTELRNFLGAPARVYTLHRIAGEKLRAYLTSLPEYRRKMGGGARDLRVKYLYDLARILKARPAEDGPFWEKVAVEFDMACASRYVDCSGLETFMQDWQRAREAYHEDRHFDDLSFADVETALITVVKLMARSGAFPKSYKAPSTGE